MSVETAKSINFFKKASKFCFRTLQNITIITVKLLPFLKNPLWMPLWTIVLLFKGDRGVALHEARLLYLFVKMLKPKLVVETGTNRGYSASYIGFALARNKSGHCHTLEKDIGNMQKAHVNFKNLGLKKWLSIHQGDSLEQLHALINGKIINHNLDLAYLDSGTPATIEEFEILQKHIRPGKGYLICHDVFFPQISGKGVLLYPYLRDKYSASWDICVFHTGGAGFVIARKRGTDSCDAYKSLENYEIKDWQDYKRHWLPKVTG